MRFRHLSNLLLFSIPVFFGGWDIRVRADSPNDFTPVKNIRYAGTDNERQMLDLYLPKKPATSPQPLLVYIHGGGWEGGSKNDVSFIPALITNGNYVVASVGYRLTNEGGWPIQIHDCKAAIRWLRANAAKYNIDPDRIAVFGISAGGHLVSMLGVTSGSGTPEIEGAIGPHTDTSSKVRCVVNFCGPANFLSLPGQGSDIDSEKPGTMITKLLGGPTSERKDVAMSASPVTFITKDDPPFLSIYGTKDNLVPYAQALEFDKKLDDAGVPSILLTGKDGPHVFVSPELLKRIRDFLSNHLEGSKIEVPEGEVPIK